MEFTLRGFLVGASSVLLATATAMATPVNGKLDISSQTNTTVMTGAIYFGTGDHTATGTNTVSPNAGSGTGDFAGVTNTSPAWFRNLVGPGGPTGAPVSGDVNIPDFAEITTPGGVVQIDLNRIDPGVGSEANCAAAVPGTACTPIIDGVKSPFTIFQFNSNTVIFGLQFEGVAYFPPPSSGTSQLVSIFSSQSVAGTIPQILADVESSSGFSDSWSDTIIASPIAVPEPASLLLMGVGLLGIGVIARKRTKRAS